MIETKKLLEKFKRDFHYRQGIIRAIVGKGIKEGKLSNQDQTRKDGLIAQAEYIRQLILEIEDDNN